MSLSFPEQLHVFIAPPAGTHLLMYISHRIRLFNIFCLKKSALLRLFSALDAVFGCDSLSCPVCRGGDLTPGSRMF
jgi:hypothetical protein